MNAGGRPNTCKSSGNRECLHSADERRTGEQYLGICPIVGDNTGKLVLIPHTPYGGKQASACAIG